jgi:hypothetical protein
MLADMAETIVVLRLTRHHNKVAILLVFYKDIVLCLVR